MTKDEEIAILRKQRDELLSALQQIQSGDLDIDTRYCSELIDHIEVYKLTQE